MNSAYRFAAEDLPPLTATPGGEPRRIGWEIEFAGIALTEAGRIVGTCLSAEPRRVTDYEIECTDREGRTWRIERDHETLKRLGRLSEQGEIGFVEELTEAALRIGSELVVPIEVVSPPIPINETGLFCDVCDALRDAGAKGTADNFAYAFGLHLNPEAPSLDAENLFAYLRAYACLQDWLFERAGLDASRQLTRYTAPYPDSYVRELVGMTETPDIESLILTYLEYNSTRNRALDMLPVFSEINSGLVRKHLDDPRIKSRPTYHFRLPNCDIDNPHWSPADAWKEWLYVERLAADRRLLNDICERARAHFDSPLDSLLGGWRIDVDKWISDNLSSA